MPADHLTPRGPSPNHVENAILQALAGASVHETAESWGLTANDLADAIAAYRAAGLATLDQQKQSGWHHIRIGFTDEQPGEAVAATHLGPALDHLQANGAISGWWFLRKPPGWRLRMSNADRAAVSDTLHQLTTQRILDHWTQGIYEPETTAFGGPDGTRIIHDLFCIDSRGVISALQDNFGNLDRREVSLLLINALLQAAELDWFERGDVFAQLSRLRPPPASPDTGRLSDLANTIRPLLGTTIEPDASTFRSDDARETYRTWFDGFATAGHRLLDAAANGQLDRGLRNIIAHIVIFHWNRIGLSATSQAVLAAAATAAILEGATPWTTAI